MTSDYSGCKAGIVPAQQGLCFRLLDALFSAASAQGGSALGGVPGRAARGTGKAQTAKL